MPHHSDPQGSFWDELPSAGDDAFFWVIWGFLLACFCTLCGRCAPRGSRRTQSARRRVEVAETHRDAAVAEEEQVSGASQDKMMNSSMWLE